MIGMKIHLDGDGIWPDLVEKQVREGEIEVAALQGGLKSGLPSVAIRLDLEDGSVVFAQTSMRLFLAAADAFRARYGSQLN